MKKQKGGELLKKGSEMSSSVKKGRILLVEDHKMVQLLVRKFLINADYEVDVVSDGETALEMTEQYEYDLILMDLKLPGVDGYETAKIIRESKVLNGRVPILALTSSAEYEVREKMFDAGMNDYIGKPLNPKELTRKIEVFLH